MERIVVFKSSVNPVTTENDSSELFSYRGVFLAWGIRTDMSPDNSVPISNTIAIVECIDTDADGNHPVLTFLPEEISFES